MLQETLELHQLVLFQFVAYPWLWYRCLSTRWLEEGGYTKWPWSRLGTTMFPSLGEGATPARCLQLSQTHMCILYYGACTASTDHRGTKEYPGRTVTLEPKEGVITVSSKCIHQLLKFLECWYMNLCSKGNFNLHWQFCYRGSAVNHVHRKISSEVNFGFYFALEHTANDLP